MYIRATSSEPKESDLLPADLQGFMVTHLEDQLALAEEAVGEAKAAVAAAEEDLRQARADDRAALAADTTAALAAGGVGLPVEAYLSPDHRLVARPVQLAPGTYVRGCGEQSNQTHRVVQVMAARLTLARAAYQRAKGRERDLRRALERCRHGLVPTAEVIAETVYTSRVVIGRALVNRTRMPTAEEVREAARRSAPTPIERAQPWLPRWMQRR